MNVWGGSENLVESDDNFMSMLKSKGPPGVKLLDCLKKKIAYYIVREFFGVQHARKCGCAYRFFGKTTSNLIV